MGSLNQGWTSRILVISTFAFIAFYLVFAMPGGRGFSPDTVTAATHKGGSSRHGSNSNRNSTPKTTSVTGQIQKIQFTPVNTLLLVGSGDGTVVTVTGSTKITVGGQSGVRHQFQTGDQVNCKLQGSLAVSVDVTTH